MKKLSQFVAGRSPQTVALSVAGVIVGLLLFWKFTSAHPSHSSLSTGKDLTPPEAAVASLSKLPEGPRFAVVKGSHAYSNREAASEFAKEYERAVNLDEKAFNNALNVLSSRHEKEGRRFTFSRDCIVIPVAGEAMIGEVHCVMVAGAQGKEAAPIWIEEKYLMDSSTVVGSRILTGFYILRGSESADLGGVSISDLREMLSALYEGQVSKEQAKKCVFVPDTQCAARVESVLTDHVICAVRGGSGQPFAMKRDRNDKDPFSGVAIRYIGHESFTTKNGTVRVIPVFEIVPGVR